LLSSRHVLLVPVQRLFFSVVAFSPMPKCPPKYR
jgi:hypothetical protein